MDFTQYNRICDQVWYNDDTEELKKLAKEFSFWKIRHASVSSIKKDIINGEGVSERLKSCCIKLWERQKRVKNYCEKLYEQNHQPDINPDK